MSRAVNVSRCLKVESIHRLNELARVVQVGQMEELRPMEPKRVKVEVVTAGAEAGAGPGASAEAGAEAGAGAGAVAGASTGLGKAKAKAKTKAKTKTKTKTAGKSTSDAPAKTKLGPAWTLTSSEAQKRRYMAIEAVRSIHPSICWYARPQFGVCFAPGGLFAGRPGGCGQTQAAHGGAGHPVRPGVESMTISANLRARFISFHFVSVDQRPSAASRPSHVRGDREARREEEARRAAAVQAEAGQAQGSC